MSFWIAGATVVGAGLSYMGSRSASKDASGAASDQLGFEQEKYDDWNDIYGPVQDNLADYYGGLTPEYYEVQGLEAFEKEKAVAFEQLDAELAQRGITDSGIAASIESQQALSSAQTRAQIRTEAPAKAAEEKLRFLQVGLGQNPGSSLSQTLSQRTASTAATAQESARVAGGAISTAVTTVGTALSDYNNEGAK